MVYQGANTSAPAGANAYFEYTWNNTSSSSISAKINIIADDEASVIVNDETIGTQKGGWGGSGGLFNVTLPPGANDFVFIIWVQPLIQQVYWLQL